jgi:putative tricarboxylic transport membrane protein
MSADGPQVAPEHWALRMLRRKNVLAGLMFIGVAAFGLWVSRNYPIGTALSMGTGYVPRLLCWILLGLGIIILVQGLRETATGHPHSYPPPQAGEGRSGGLPARLWPVVVVTASLASFALAIERLGLVLTVILMVAIGSLAARGIKPWETAATALGLILLSWAIFIRGLGLTIPVWPDW